MNFPTFSFKPIYGQVCHIQAFAAKVCIFQRVRIMKLLIINSAFKKIMPYMLSNSEFGKFYQKDNAIAA